MRQKSCAGLQRRFYPSHLRDLLDFDYADRLPAKDREWLAAFAEEYYRGWQLSGETQIHAPAALREADAARSRARRMFRALPDGVRLEPLTEARAVVAVTPDEAELVAQIDVRMSQRERRDRRGWKRKMERAATSVAAVRVARAVERSSPEAAAQPPTVPAMPAAIDHSQRSTRGAHEANSAAPPAEQAADDDPPDDGRAAG